ncbi:hypothetical protein SAMN06296386_101212 [Lachnospiraceae bacterium]|nr:hypothetical protein SAMN06296386_101212 [Lachnospiraceae bacterium]
MRFHKRIAVLLCAALVLNTVAPVSAAEVRGDNVDCVGDDYLVNVDESIDNERVRFKEIDDAQEIMEIRNQVSANLKSMDHTMVSWEDGLEFIGLIDSTLSNNKYRLKANYGSVSEENYGYIVQNGKVKYSVVDVNGNKVKGLKKSDVWWRTYLYKPAEQDIIKEPESISVHDGTIECSDELYNRVIIFARYNGMTSMSMMLITHPTKYIGRFINGKFVTKATASCNYRVGDTIDIENVQKLVGATKETAVYYLYDREKNVSSNGYTYMYWAIPETPFLNRSDNRPSELISNIRKGAYMTRVNKMKNIEPTYNRFGNITSFVPKKRGIYKVTYIVPDGYNKKFTVKVRVTE